MSCTFKTFQNIINEIWIQICKYEYSVQNTNGDRGKNIQLFLAWDIKGKPHFEAENLDYDAEISFKNLKTTAGIELKLTRKFTRCLVEIILPTALLVLVCSVSFNLSSNAASLMGLCIHWMF